MARKIWEIIQKEHGQHFKGIRCAYDGRRNIYTPKMLTEHENDVIQIRVEMRSNRPDKPGRGFDVTIKKVANVSMTALINFVKGTPAAMAPYESIQVTDSIS